MELGSQNPDLMIGGINLKEYLSNPKKLNENKKQEIDELIGKLERNVLNIEQLPLKLLKIQRAQYPMINPSFLDMHNSKNGLQLPRFGVYRKSDKGFDDFEIQTYSWRDGDWKNVKTGFFSSDKKFIRNGTYEIKIKINNGQFPDIFEIPLLKSFGFYDLINKEESTPTCFQFNHVPSQIGQKYHSGNGVGCDHRKLTGQFCGVLPQKTKEKMEEAESIFDNELYLISEIKPEQWETKKIINDPLLTGILEDKCYLVDHFNTTSIENYVRREFIE